MAAPRNRIKRFLESALARSEELEVVLFIVNVAGRKTEIWASDKRWTVDDAAAQIIESAQGTADGQSGVSRFTLQVFGPGTKRERAIATMSFACANDDDDESIPAVRRYLDTVSSFSSDELQVLFETRILNKDQYIRLLATKARNLESKKDRKS